MYTNNKQSNMVPCFLVKVWLWALFPLFKTSKLRRMKQDLAEYFPGTSQKGLSQPVLSLLTYGRLLGFLTHLPDLQRYHLLIGSLMISPLLPRNFDLNSSPSAVLHSCSSPVQELWSTTAKPPVCKAYELAWAAVTLNKSLHLFCAPWGLVFEASSITFL